MINLLSTDSTLSLLPCAWPRKLRPSFCRQFGPSAAPAGSRRELESDADWPWCMAWCMACGAALCAGKESPLTRKP